MQQVCIFYPKPSQAIRIVTIEATPSKRPILGSLVALMGLANKTIYNSVISGVPKAWRFLRSHPHKETEGSDHISIEQFAEKSRKNLQQIKDLLRKGVYKFSELRTSTLKKGSREILIATVQDRVVSRAILEAIDPLFFDYKSGADYSVRQHSGVKAGGVILASRKIQEAIRSGYDWVFETDIQNFFDAIPKNKILAILKKKIPDAITLDLVEQIVRFRIRSNHSSDFVTPEKYGPSEGLAQGSALSPLLATIYLYDFDRHIQQFKDVVLIRYVDDFIILCKSEKRAQEMFEEVAKKMKELGLAIHEFGQRSSKGDIKTRIVNSRKHFEFLGLGFNHATIDIPDKKKQEFREKIHNIISNKNTRFIEKARRINMTLLGFINHYDQGHFNTKTSIISLCQQATKTFQKYYLYGLAHVFGWTHLRKMKPNDLIKLHDFLGISFEKMTSGRASIMKAK